MEWLNHDLILHSVKSIPIERLYKLPVGSLLKLFTEFENIIRKFSPTDYEQFMLLKQSGRSLKLIKTLAITDRLYDVAKKPLLEAFASPQSLKFESIRRLFKFQKDRLEPRAFATEIRLIQEEVRINGVIIDDIMQYCFWSSMSEPIKNRWYK